MSFLSADQLNFALRVQIFTIFIFFFEYANGVIYLVKGLSQYSNRHKFCSAFFHRGKLYLQNVSERCLLFAGLPVYTQAVSHN